MQRQCLKTIGEVLFPARYGGGARLVGVTDWLCKKIRAYGSMQEED